MYLARDKYGRLGRQVKSMGETAVVESAPVVSEHRDIYVSNQTVIEDDLNQKWDDRQKRIQARAEMIAQKRAEALEAARLREGEALALEQQNQIPRDPNEAALKNYFLRQANMSETERMNRSVKADFYDREMVPGLPFTSRAFNPRADFSTNAITGSPLTNDGSFGPSTDYDRFVYGTELDNDRIEDGAMVVGGTMLGRYNGKNVSYKPKGLGRSWKGRHKFKTMGDEFDDFEALPDDDYTSLAETDGYFDEGGDEGSYEGSDEGGDEGGEEAKEPGWLERTWGAFTTGVTTGIQKEAEKIPAQVQADIQRQTQALIQQGLNPKQAEAQAKKQIKIIQAKGPIQKFAAQLGVPAWVLYAGIGAIAVGGVALVLKSKKS